MAHWISRGDPAPCVEVDLPDRSTQRAGYAVLADRKGGAHFLLIPTQTIPGIESPALTEPGAPNYFALAWQSRRYLDEIAGRKIPRQDVGLAINPPRARSQDQLHIHIECLRAEVVRAIAAAAGGLGASWTPLQIAGTRFYGLRLAGAELGARNPFTILSRDPPESGRGPAEFTLVLAGGQFREGPGFALLAAAGRAGELLLDSTCAAAA